MLISGSKIIDFVAWVAAKRLGWMVAVEAKRNKLSDQKLSQRILTNPTS